jgi:hypothetical protein
MDKLPDVIAVKHLGGCRLMVTFSDGATGEVDLEPVLRERNVGFYRELLDPKTFAAAYVDEEAGTVAWPGGIDWDPLVLHSMITGAPLPGQQPV